MKALLVSLLLVLSIAAPAPLFAQENSKLGLAERRAIKQYQETKWPELKKNIEAAAKFEVPIEVNWEMIAQTGEADHYLEDDYWTNIYFKPLTEALKTITADQEGTDSLKKNLKKVVITYDEKTAPASNYDNGVLWKDGVLTLNFRPWSNSADVADRTKAIKTALEKVL